MTSATIVVDPYHTKDRVDFGAALLNEYSPGWYWHIERDRLSMSSAWDCVGAQLTQWLEKLSRQDNDAWFTFMHKFSQWFNENSNVTTEVILDAAGFEPMVLPTTQGRFSEYAALTRAWKDIIKDRREQDV